MTDYPSPLSANIRRHPSGLATIELVMTEGQVEACGRCPGRCKATPIEEGSATFRCRHRKPQAQLHGFLFGPTIEPEPAPDPDDAEPTAASRLAVDVLCGRKIFVDAWTEEAWAIEDHRPADAWPVNGGGRLRITPIREPGQAPIAFRPAIGPAPRCWWPYWLDVEAPVGDLRMVFRFSLWPHDGPECPPSAYVAAGDGQVAFVGVDLITTFDDLRKQVKAK